MSSREQILADLLDRLVEAGDAERESILAEVAARDPSQARELGELLAALPDPERLGLDAPRPAVDAAADAAAATDAAAAGAAADAAADDRFAGEPDLGEMLGGCVLESVLGRGGGGTVFAARQLEPPRPVAIKVLRVARTRARDIDRFRREANALARLEHAAIARIYASGIGRDGDIPLPYIVMERIADACSIVEWARAAGRTHAATALAFATVCDGMQQGHNRGVIHRDLKPSNILVDGDDRPRVIDFGVARLVSGDDDSDQETVAGALIGTPAYMAPEQFELAGAEIDARVDIHAIGLILYESLLGRRAYDITRERAFDARRIVRETDPPVPHRVDSHIPADLSAIAMKAMAKDRERRYPSMSALAEDLRAFVDGRAVSARAETRAERLVRLVRRNPVPSAALAIAIGSLAVAVALSSTALAAAKRRSASAEMVIAMAAASEGNLREATAALDRIDTPTEPILRGMVERMLDDSVAEPIAPAIGHLIGGALSPDGSLWAAGGEGGNIVVAEVGGRELGRAKMTRDVWGVAFSPDGTRLFAGDWTGEIVEIDLRSVPSPPSGASAALATRRLASVGNLIRAMFVTPDGARLLVLSSPGVLSTVEIADGTVRSSVSAAPQGQARSLGWAGDGRAFVVGGSGELAAFDLVDGAAPVLADLPWLAGVLPGAHCIGVSRDGSTLVVGSAVGEIRAVDARTGAPRFSARVGHAPWSFDFSPDGSRLAIAERGGRVHELSIADGTELARHGTLSPEPAWVVRYAPDRSIVAAIGLRLERFAADARWATRLDSFPHGLPRALAMLDCDGPAPILRAAASDGTVWDLDLTQGSWREIPLPAPVAPGAAAFDPDGMRLAAWCDSGVEIVSLKTGSHEGAPRVRVPLPPRGRRAIAWDPAGDELTGVSEGEVHMIRADGTVIGSGTVAPEPFGYDIVYEATRKPVVHLRFYRRAVLTRGANGAIDSQVEKIASASNLVRIGSRWALSSISGPVLVSAEGGTQVLGETVEDFDTRLIGHTDAAYAIAMTPDGRLLATGGSDTRVRLWDLARGEQLASALLCDRPIRFLSWIDQGRALLALDASGKVTLLDSVPRRTRVAESPIHASTR